MKNRRKDRARKATLNAKRRQLIHEKQEEWLRSLSEAERREHLRSQHMSRPRQRSQMGPGYAQIAYPDVLKIK